MSIWITQALSSLLMADFTNDATVKQPSWHKTNCLGMLRRLLIYKRISSPAAALRRTSPTAIGRSPPPFFGIASKSSSANQRGAVPLATLSRTSKRLLLQRFSYAYSKWSTLRPDGPGPESRIAHNVAKTAFDVTEGVVGKAVAGASGRGSCGWSRRNRSTTASVGSTSGVLFSELRV